MDTRKKHAQYVQWIASEVLFRDVWRMLGSPLQLVSLIDTEHSKFAKIGPKKLQFFNETVLYYQQTSSWVSIYLMTGEWLVPKVYFISKPDTAN